MCDWDRVTAERFCSTGTYIHDGGDKYIGAFKNGNRYGAGIYTWDSGEKHDGLWVEGKRKGKGIRYYKNGTSKTGIWKGNELQSQTGCISGDCKNGTLRFVCVVEPPKRLIKNVQS